jgi:uncharacterized coiled-coil DUF342 family protein
MPNLKKVQKASDDISAKLRAIAKADKDREDLRKRRDDLNEQITALTQQISAAKTDLDLSVDELRKGMAE